MSSERFTSKGSWRSLVVAGIAGLGLCCVKAHAHSLPDAVPTVEYQVKASLALNFLHFIAWPQDELDSDDGNIPVCMIGDDHYGTALPSLNGQVVQGRTLTVRTYPSASEPGWVDDCRVVIVVGDDGAEIRRILELVDGRSVLTIGESPRFLERGGIIRYVVANDSVQFEINAVASRRARLAISSKLLRLAIRVIED